MEDLIRESPFGQIVRWATKNKVFQYPEEKPDFQLPEAYVTAINSEKQKPLSATPSTTLSRSGSNVNGSDPEKEHEADHLPNARLSTVATLNSPEAGHEPELVRTRSRQETTPYTQDRFDVERQESLSRAESRPIAPVKTSNGDILVDWYDSDDQGNPQNWSAGIKFWISFVICLYTFVVYSASAIYTSSIEGVSVEYGLTPAVASLGLSLYVLAYGIGPLIFAPMSEIASIGRSPVYFATFVVFVIVSIPAGFVKNFAGLVVLRFLQGFFGSPCLANGAATMQDIYSMMQFPYALIACEYLSRIKLLAHANSL